MRTTFQTPRRNQAGYALLITMCFLVVCLIVFASMMSWCASNAKVTQRNNLFNQSMAAAESASETALAYMARDYLSQSLNAASSYHTNIPSQTGWPIQFTFSDTNGNTGQISVSIGNTNWMVLGSQFSGLYGLAQNVTNTATATPLNQGVNLSATVQQWVQFATIPVFQYAIFYNMDLEINPGTNMTINGQVHSNNNIWTTGSSAAGLLTYKNLVEAAGAVTLTRSTNDPSYTNVVNHDVVFVITNGNPLANGDSLSLPIGTSTNNNPINVEAILNLPPAPYSAPTASTSAAYSPTGQVYVINEADLIVSNSSSGALTVFYQNPNNTTVITQVPFDVTNVVAGVTNKYYSFVTNVTFYDYRETDTVYAVQLNVTNLNSWLTNSKGGLTYDNIKRGIPSASTSMGGKHINSIYVYNSVPLTSAHLPAVRLVNGSQLPQSGLTVATAMPLYVEGNYNTTSNGVDFALTLGSTTNTASGHPTTVPAALMADAITVLSPTWSDANTTNTSLASRDANDTTINAAALEGIVPSDGSHYSGGVENFLRLLEDWGGNTLTYNGSIVVMFPSQYATNFWPNTGKVYNPPIRQWGFDVNFASQGGLPPLSPGVKGIIRNTWAAW